MPPAPRAWQLRPHDDAAVRLLARQADVSPVVAQLLLNRGVSRAADARAFLDAPMSALHPPHLLPGVPAAAERIAAAAAARTPICVYGDYDVDGTTGTAILVGLLTMLGADVRYYVPNRVGEGYGVNAAAVRQLAEDGVKLLVTVDCGIGSVAEAEVARGCGVELIVTDHHEMRAELPNALIVHPRLPGSAYPFAGLSGSCVAFKLAWAVAQRATNRERVPDEFKAFLQDAMGLAALGLIADVMPLRDENRAFVRHGLKRLADRPSVGVKALLTAAGLLTTGDDGRATTSLKAEDVGYKIGPRINAAGRLDFARMVVDLLTTRNPVAAREAAEFLEALNARRQTIERNLTQAAKEVVEEKGYADAPAIVLGQLDWHPGVVGIVAGRLAEYYGRPALVAAIKDGEAVCAGSARAGGGGFALHTALAECEDVLEGYGGHAAAAGFRVQVSRLDELRERFCAVARRAFPDGPPAPVLRLDAEVPLASLTFALMADLDKLEPYGTDNPRPRFLAAGLTIDGTPRRIGQGERHLSFQVRQGGGKIRAVAWGMGDRLDDLMAAGGACCLAFTPKVNEWNGYRSVEIEVADFQAGPVPVLG